MCFYVVKYNEKWYKNNYNDDKYWILIYYRQITTFFHKILHCIFVNFNVYMMPALQVIAISRFNYQIVIKILSKLGCNLEKKIIKIKIFKWLFFMTITWWFIFIYIDILNIMRDCFISVDNIMSSYPSDISSTIMSR